MCKAVEDFAKDYARKKELDTILGMAKDLQLDKGTVISQIKNRMGISDEEAEKAYDDYFAVANV